MKLHNSSFLQSPVTSFHLGQTSSSTPYSRKPFVRALLSTRQTMFHTHVELTYSLTPWCRVLLEKLTGLQLVKKFPAFHGNPKVHYRTHKSPPPVPILGQPNPVHIPTSHLLEIRPNIIHPSTPRSPQWSPSLRFPQQGPIRNTRHRVRQNSFFTFADSKQVDRRLWTKRWQAFFAFPLLLISSHINFELLVTSPHTHTSSPQPNPHTQTYAPTHDTCRAQRHHKIQACATRMQYQNILKHRIHMTNYINWTWRPWRIHATHIFCML